MASAWLASTARLPFVAGADRSLPEAFGRVHPRWGVPHVALLVQAAGTALFAVLGQAGTTVRGAYDALVSMGVITYFLPFLVLFAALIRLQREPAPAGTIRVPGGVPMARALGVLGFASTAAAMVLAVIPPPDAGRPVLAVIKVVGASAVLVAVGAWLYASGSRRRRAADLQPRASAAS
jgi:amino acid transporter